MDFEIGKRPLQGFGTNKKLASGDDEYLLKKFYEMNKDGVAFENSPDMMIKTKSTYSLVNFISQRLRWISKWRSSINVPSILMVVACFVFYGVYFTTIHRGIIENDIQKVLILVVGKILLEFLFTLIVSRKLKC